MTDDRCPDCDGEVVPFTVPEDLREHAPEEASAASICATCLGVDAADGPEPDGDAELARVLDSFPTGEAGVALALLLGTLPSVALCRESAVALRERAEREGADVALALDRLIVAADAGTLEPAFDLGRRVAQFESLAERS